MPETKGYVPENYQEETEINSESNVERAREVRKFMESEFGIKDLSMSEWLYLKKLTLQVVKEDNQRREYEEKTRRKLNEGVFLNINLEVTMRWLSDLYGLDLTQINRDFFDSHYYPYGENTVTDLNTGERFIYRQFDPSRPKTVSTGTKNSRKPDMGRMAALNEALEKDRQLTELGHETKLTHAINQEIVHLIKTAREEAKQM